MMAGLIEKAEPVASKAMYEMASASTLARVRLAGQDVRAATAPQRTLYKECFATLTDVDGVVHGAPDFIPYFARSGCLPFLDRHVLRLTFELLGADPGIVLGCNLSANNFDSDESWGFVMREISAHQALADRLVIEITETEEFIDTERARGMLDEARKLGCRIAIDDFGSGFATADRLCSLDVDIVKIDASLIKSVRMPFGYNNLKHMVNLAFGAAPIVIVEGVGSICELQTAIRAGATHVQGYLYSRPTVI